MNLLEPGKYATLMQAALAFVKEYLYDPGKRPNLGENYSRPSKLIASNTPTALALDAGMLSPKKKETTPVPAPETIMNAIA